MRDCVHLAVPVGLLLLLQEDSAQVVLELHDLCEHDPAVNVGVMLLELAIPFFVEFLFRDIRQHRAAEPGLLCRHDEARFRQGAPIEVKRLKVVLFSHKEKFPIVA